MPILIDPTDLIDDDSDTSEVVPLGFGDEGITALVDTGTGEVIDLPECPLKSNGDPVTREAIAWFADRRIRAHSRIEANKAGKAAYIAYAAMVAEREYDARIKRDESLIRWLDNLYIGGLELFAKAACVANGKKSVTVDGVLLKFTKVGGGIGFDPAKESLTLAYLHAVCPAAIKETLLKTPIADLIGKGEPSEAMTLAGIIRVPVSEKFEVK